MKVAVALLSLIFLTSPALVGGFDEAGMQVSRGASTTSVESPEVLLRDWIAMWNSYDLNEVDRLFLTDDRVSYFSSEKNDLIQGIAEVRRHHEGFSFVRGGNRRGTKLWVEKPRIQAFGDTVVIGGTWVFERPGVPAAQAQRGPITLVAIKTPDGWRVAHAHFSNNR